MIRWIILAMMLGALVAAAGLSAAIEFPWRSSIAAWLGAPDRKAEAKMPLEDWPICTTMGTMGSEADWAQLDPDFAAGKKTLVPEDWNGAVMALKLPALPHRRHRGPHGHLGDLYLVLREAAKAEQQLATLEDICLIPCAETDDLKRAIAVYNTLAAR